MKTLVYVYAILFFTSCDKGLEEKKQPTPFSEPLKITIDTLKPEKISGKLLFAAIMDTIHLKPLSKDILVGSKWESTVADNYVDTYTFNIDMTGTSYSCEMSLKSDIKYDIIKDTLFIDEYNMPTEDNREHEVIKMWSGKYIYNGQALILVDAKLWNMRSESWTVKVNTIVSYRQK